MSALRELQQSFVDALFADAFIDRFEGALDVYRNNLRVGFAKALAMTFPVFERLVGEQYFEQVAAEFLRAHPSRSGNLQHIGAPFPAFLRQKFTGTEYTYLSDVAELEWAHEEVLVAADDEPIGPGALQAVPASDYGNIHFELRDAIRLVRSEYPIVDIWRTNQPDAAGDEIVDLGSGGQHVLVIRTPDDVEFHRLPAGEFTALRALAGGASLAEAFEAALAAEPAFDLAPALQHFFRLNLFTALSTEDSP